MGTEILHFGQLETEKNEFKFKVFKSNLKRPKIWMHKTFYQFLQNFSIFSPSNLLILM